MSVKAEHRYQNMLDREANQRFVSMANTEVAKAAMWRELIEKGYILTFKACNGRTITAGKYQTATGKPEYALLGLKQDYFGGPMGISWEILKHCGRVKPIAISA